MRNPAAEDEFYYELRLYEMVQARLPPMIDIMSRVPHLFARNGVSTPLTLWSSFAGPLAPLYGYLLRWSNLDDRMKGWGQFYSDPDWIEMMTKAYAGEQMVERAHISFMRASPIWARFRGASDKTFDGFMELRRYRTVGRHDAGPLDAISSELEALTEAGGSVLGAFETIIGAVTPQTVVFIGWPNDISVRQRATKKIAASGLPSGQVAHDSFLLKPTDYGHPLENFADRPAWV